MVGSLGKAMVELKGKKAEILIEPFAGGGIIGLTAAFEGYVEHVVFVEKDPEVAAVWKCVLSENYSKLCEKILSFEVTENNVKEIIENEYQCIEDAAFRTIIKNRMLHGGILAPGASLMKAGEKGKGLKSRWYANTLANRISAIGSIRNRFKFIEGDGMEVLHSYRNNEKAIFFIDPPYTADGKKAGSRLYRYNELDHAHLFCAAAQLKGDLLITYDNAPAVRHLAATSGFDTELVAMKNTHHAKMTELLIGRDLSWARPSSDNLRQIQFNFDV